MSIQQQVPANRAMLEALDRLQASLRERGIDLAWWEQVVKAERTGKGKAMNKDKP